ncbi:MAG: leucyl aminopeptidase [Bdellovibrionaceae bacterium]|nr:leucyl aminopeptidase [Pseudobdellovibrionaceae bacterium]
MSLLNLTLTKTSATQSVRDTLVVFSASKSAAKAGGKDAKKSTAATASILHAGVAKRLSDSLSAGAISGKLKDAVLFREIGFEGFQNVLVIGVGAKTDAEALRTAAASACKALGAAKAKSAAVMIDGLGARDLTHVVRGLTEGFILTSYKFDELKSKKKDAKTEEALNIRLVTAKAADKGVKAAFDAAVILAETTNFSRRLGDMPGNLMTPTILADTTVEAAKGTKLKVTVWDKKRIEKERMGGLLGVAQGSAQEPRFIIMEYKGAAASKKPVVFVGKGLTFDTGGISIKPSAGMEEMKYDMCGGANVIGALIAIAKLGLKVNAVGLVASTENMPGSRATKPGDIHTARNGKTFEVNNTDAEGRLILADALSYGTELQPELMVDAATLTGAMVMALGNTHTGYFTRDSKVRDRVEKAAAASGEWVWNMPLTDFHVDDIKGTYADLSNISSSKGAGSATAAAFLEQFVGDGIPWAHFDIAGTAWHCGNRLAYAPSKGATGAIVRTFVEIARSFAQK